MFQFMHRLVQLKEVALSASTASARPALGMRKLPNIPADFITIYNMYNNKNNKQLTLSQTLSSAACTTLAQNRWKFPSYLRVLIAATALFPSSCQATQSRISSSGTNIMAVEATETAAGVVPIPTPKLLLSMASLIPIIVASRKMGLDLEKEIVISTIRTFVQLSILGSILRPIFMMKNMYLVVGYCLMMIVLAANVACQKTKYVFLGQYYTVLGSILASVAFTSLFAFTTIIRPQPVWNPRYVIPMVGMLLGNSVNGISIAMNNLCAALVEKQREIELYLSFGATSYEAVSRLLREAVRSGATPILNSMAVIGIISIPGMMTGQILGGSPVIDAAKYQMLIMYLIAVSTFGAMMMEIWVILGIGFDSSHVLQTHNFSKAPDSQSLLDVVKHSLLATLFVARTRNKLVTSGEMEPLRNGDADNTKLSYKEKWSQFEVLPMKEYSYCSLEDHFVDDSDFLIIGGLTKSFVTDDENDTTQPSNVRTLFSKLSFNLRSGEVYLVRGPSGSGKSQLLRSIAGLGHVDEGFIELDGTRLEEFDCASDWRQQVRYVPQYNIDIPGSPRDFVHRVTSFKSWKQGHRRPNEQEMIETAIEMVKQWGLPANCLDKEWSKLSGGEAQRVIVALSLASKPSVLLLDESTSAMDMETKAAVERTIDGFIRENRVKVLWVSHDPGILFRTYE